MTTVGIVNAREATKGKLGFLCMTVMCGLGILACDDASSSTGADSTDGRADAATSAPDVPLGADDEEAEQDGIVCAPICQEQGRVCGDDGCGGTCGQCEIDRTCSASGQCVSCTPHCEGRECGSDGCGGLCGECDAAQLLVCMPEIGKCAKFDPPQCEGKVCGDDGMGGSCGTCEEGFVCLDGKCNSLSGCQPDCADKECGTDGCDGSCGQCDAAQLLVCMPEIGKCVKFAPPQCEGKVCGDDGMGGSCGTCEEGFICQDGKCTP